MVKQHFAQKKKHSLAIRDAVLHDVHRASTGMRINLFILSCIYSLLRCSANNKSIQAGFVMVNGLEMLRRQL